MEELVQTNVPPENLENIEGNTFKKICLKASDNSKGSKNLKGEKERLEI